MLNVRLIFISFLLSFSINTNAQESSWQWINPYPLPFFSSMQEGVNGEIYLWNDYDELYRYVNGDLKHIHVPNPYSFFNYYQDRFSAYTYIVNDSTWYVYNQILGNYYTVDGGISYVETPSTSSGFHINMQAINEKEIIAIAKDNGQDRKMLVTEDHGETWDEIYKAQNLFYPYRSGSDTIFALANDTIIYTFDRGQTWNKGAECKSCNSFQFENEKLFISSDVESILLSEDYGNSYYKLYQLEHDFSLGGVYGGSPRFKLEGELGCAISFQRLYVTENQGETFQFYDYLLPFNISINSCTVVNNKVLIDAFMPLKNIIEFDLDTKEFKNNFSNGLFNLRNFHVINDSTYVLTSNSNNWDFRKIHISYNKGYNWETKLLPVGDILEYELLNYGFDILPDNTGVLATKANIYKAPFPYDNWTELTSPTDTSSQAIQFHSDKEGYLLDYLNNVFLTKNLGESWEFVTQLNNENYYVDIFSSRKSHTSFIFQQLTWGINKSLVYIFQDGALQDSITLLEQRGNYHGGYVYEDSLLYLSFYNKTYKIDMTTSELEELCSINHGKVVHRKSDTLWVKNEGIMYKMNEMCQVVSSDTFSYSRHVSSGYVNPLDLIELYVDDSGEAFGYYPRGYMLKYTDDFREDLLVGTEEISFSSNKNEKEKIYLFPNPTNGNLQLNANLKKPTIFFYSTDGRRVGSFHENSFTLPNELRGLFFYTILEDGKYVSTGKVVVE